MTAATAEFGGKRELFAFIEIAMPSGWKTYWRNPGDAGGLPPSFDWSKSENLSSATVLYPAPKRLTDEAGDTIGYKDHVTFPVLIVPKDAAKPVRLGLEMSYGICKDICVPSEGKHALEVDPAGATEAGDGAKESLARVPRMSNQKQAGDPELKRASLDTSSAKSKLVLEVSFAGGLAGADIFIEAPDGLYVPMPAKAGQPNGAAQVFEAELGSALEPKDLEGKTLTATMVSDTGQAIATFKVD